MQKEESHKGGTPRKRVPVLEMFTTTITPKDNRHETQAHHAFQEGRDTLPHIEKIVVARVITAQDVDILSVDFAARVGVDEHTHKVCTMKTGPHRKRGEINHNHTLHTQAYLYMIYIYLYIHI
jgi:hypothetical protein